jgi:threonine aldolase
MTYPVGSSGIVGNVDFRSDTVTLPTEGMRAAMNSAALGDDVYGEDPTVNALEAKTADMLGKEAGLYVSSGTQSNLIALLTHCGRGEEYIAGAGNHISKYEAGGAAVLGGVSPRHLVPDERGTLTLDQIKAATNVDDFHFAPTRLVCLENTWNGRVQDPIGIAEIGEYTKSAGLAFHLDGARLMNAAVAGNQSAAEVSAPFDTVSLCLSKGLGAPIGSVLVGPKDFIHRARRLRKMLGGGMRQVGFLAAAGIYALDNHIDRLVEDHANARALANGLSQLTSVDIDLGSIETNMVFMKPKSAANYQAFSEAALSAGFTVPPMGETVRFVVHHDVSKNDCDRLLEIASVHLNS